MIDLLKMSKGNIDEKKVYKWARENAEISMWTPADTQTFWSWVLISKF